MGIIVTLALIAVAWYLLQNLFSSSSSSSSSNTFICKECGNLSYYSDRTLRAKSLGRGLVCNACHGNWLETRKDPPSSSSNTGFGCLTFIVIAAAIYDVVQNDSRNLKAIFNMISNLIESFN